MNQKMFCYQCEQTAACTGCTGDKGVCGKTSDIAALQDRLTGALIGLAGAAGNTAPTEEMTRLVVEALFATVTNVNFSGESRNIDRWIVSKGAGKQEL